MCVSWLILLWFKDEYCRSRVVKILTFDRCFEFYKTVSAVTASKHFIRFPVISIGGMRDKMIFQEVAGTSFCSIYKRVQQIKKAARTILFILITRRNLNIFGKDSQGMVNWIFDPRFL